MFCYCYISKLAINLSTYHYQNSHYHINQFHHVIVRVFAEIVWPTSLLMLSINVFMNSCYSSSCYWLSLWYESRLARTFSSIMHRHLVVIPFALNWRQQWFQETIAMQFMKILSVLIVACGYYTVIRFVAVRRSNISTWYGG